MRSAAESSAILRCGPTAFPRQFRSDIRASGPQPVGWVERSETHRLCKESLQGMMGFASLYPSYALSLALRVNLFSD